MSADWTEKNGVSNTSDEFERLTNVVTNLIKGSAHDLLSGRADIVAGLILAQLAHTYGFGPLKSDSCPGGCAGDKTIGYRLCPACQQGADILNTNAIRFTAADRKELEELRAHECAAWCSRCGAPHTGAPCP